MSDLPVDKLLTVDQAIAILDSVPLQPRVVSVPLDQSPGHRLAEDVFSDSDFPPFDKAVMDGFAVRAIDASLPGAVLKVVGEIPAGQVAQSAVGPGEAAAIMTGAPLPAGADAVIPVEHTTRDGDRVILHQAVKINQAVAKRGSDTSAGRLLLCKGVLLGPAQIGVAAAVGKTTIAIYDAPSVALLATGDELVEIDRTPTGSQIRNSNSHMMRALLQRLGCRVKDLGIVRDRPELIRQAIEEGLEEDALFITGGMSMGEHDYVPRLLGELGMSLRCRSCESNRESRLFLQRARTEDQLLIRQWSLDSRAIRSALLSATARLASRILARLSGGPAKTQIDSCTLVTAIPANGPRETYLPAHRTGDGVEMLNSTGSADLFTLARANALIIRLENAPAAGAGDSVRCINLL